MLNAYYRVSYVYVWFPSVTTVNVCVCTVFLLLFVNEK